MAARGATALRRGERVVVTVGAVTAHGIFVAAYHMQSEDGTPGTRKLITLDGTGETVPVPPEFIEREEAA